MGHTLLILTSVKWRNAIAVTLLTCIFLILSIYILHNGTLLSEIVDIFYMTPKALLMLTKRNIDRILHQTDTCSSILIDPYNSSLSNSTYYNNFPSNISIEQIINKRTETLDNIPICASSDAINYNQHKDILSKLPHNLIKYINRCKINAINREQRQFGGLLSGDPLKASHCTQIGFLHVYKAGGTTVRDTMNNVLPKQSRSTWHKYRGYLRQFMSHLFMFSHVRDPVTRVISSFFELHRRNETQISMNNLSGIDSFRYMLQLMHAKMDCALAQKTKEEKMKDNNIGSIYFNMHIMPQMYFLTEHANPWKSWPINYVGNMSELSESLFEILYHFYWNTSEYLRNHKMKDISREEAYEIYRDNYHHGRNRHNEAYLEGAERRAVVKGENVAKYEIEIDDLSDEDMKQICEIYWMDYICIPFRMPAACNLTQLLLKHYGDDVVYRDCWQYDTQKWDKGFVRKYNNKRMGYN